MKNLKTMVEVSGKAMVSTMTKSEKEAAWAAAAKVRGNRIGSFPAAPKYVMVNGVPHVPKGGKLVPMKKVN